MIAIGSAFLLLGGAGLLNFMPDSHRHFEVLYPNHAFPYGFVICALGFATVLGIERMLFDPDAHLLEDAGKRSVAPVLAIALSLHAVIVGFAVGSEDTAVSLLSVTAALGVHKFAASVTLGSSLGRDRRAEPGGRISIGRRQMTPCKSVPTPQRPLRVTVRAGW